MKKRTGNYNLKHQVTGQGLIYDSAGYYKGWELIRFYQKSTQGFSIKGNKLEPNIKLAHKNKNNENVCSLGAF